MVCRTDMPNLGLGLDSFHMFANKTSIDEIELLDPDRIFLVQLVDFIWREIRLVEERIATARHFRVFPGEGAHSQEVAQLVALLYAQGFRGDYSFEVFNDDYQHMPPATVTERARRSAAWLGEDILRRSVPPPGSMRLNARTESCSALRDVVLYRDWHAFGLERAHACFQFLVGHGGMGALAQVVGP